MFTFFRIYDFIIIMLYLISIYFLILKQDLLCLFIIYVHLFYLLFIISFYLLSVKINIQLEKSILGRGIIHNITFIMQNVILICILNNFIELESLVLQVYYDICLIHLLNNQVMMKQLCCQKK